MTLTPPPIRPRSDWGADLPPVGSIQVEEDVRFLLVHHTDSANVGPEQSVDQLRSFYGYHTGTKGWPDIAYNFLIDSGGQIWEGRAGSLQGPVRGDATGGSQGHAILCCFIGSHGSIPPTLAAQEAMISLLAWLADSYRIDLSEGASISFVSRGSNRWPDGATVTTDPFAGHRDMSQTTCPGDAAYPLVRGAFLPAARALVGTPTPSPTEPSSAPPTLEPTQSPSATMPPETAPSATVLATRTTAEPTLGLGEAAVAAVGLGLGAALAVVLRRRMTLGAARHGRQ